jgi:hypothetical protein
MTNAEGNTATNVAEQGPHVAPERVSLKKGATQKKAAPKGQKVATGRKTKIAGPKNVAKASKKANTPYVRRRPPGRAPRARARRS